MDSPSGGPRYYSYGGKFLGQTAGNIWSEKLNAEGRLFNYSFVSGNFKSINVSAYDPITGTVAWTTPASTPGANAQDALLQPLPGGGVVALIREQKMISGVPATPTEYWYTLATFNSGGQKVKTINLPNISTANANNVYEGSPIVVTDTSGKVVIVRQLLEKTTVSYPATVSTIEIGVINPVTGTVSYIDTLRGNANASAGSLYGYRLNYAGDNGPVTGSNTLFIQANCVGSCVGNDGSTKMYLIKVIGLGMGYPRGTVLTANTLAQPAPVPYAALGDSYSSAEGVEPFENGTDTSMDACHRSYSAYARILSRNPSLKADLNQGGFYACSGSQASDILSDQSANNEKNNEGKQIAHLNSNTKIVTLTIGGNDIGFVDFGTACVDPRNSCVIGSTAYNAAVSNINKLPIALESMYKKILDTATTAQIYVLDYPQVAPVKSASDRNDLRCAYLHDSGYDLHGDPLNWGDAQAARDIVTELDTKISTSITNVRGIKADYQRLHYVNVNTASSPFVGHTMCANPGESYFNNLDQWVGHSAFVLHPNARGQQAYADLVTAAIAAG